MKCNSCQFEIGKRDKWIECEDCGKTIHKECSIKHDDRMICDLCFMKATEEANNPKLDMEVPDVIRRSYIQLYQTCPFKFYNEVILGHEQPQNIYTQLGIDLHDLFDKANVDLSYSETEMKQDIYKIVETYPQDLYVGMDKEATIKRAIDSVETYYHVTKDMPPLFQSEQTIQFSVGEGLPKVQATSDRINRVGNELHVVDWKTGNVMVGKNLSSDLQAPLYIHSIREKYEMPVKTFTFYYLKDNKERTFEQIDRDKYVCKVGNRDYYISIPDAIKQVQSTFSLIQQGQFNVPRSAKNMYYTCKMCHIREKGLCEGADIQAWTQYNKGGI